MVVVVAVGHLEVDEVVSVHEEVDMEAEVDLAEEDMVEVMVVREEASVVGFAVVVRVAMLLTERTAKSNNGSS